MGKMSKAAQWLMVILNLILLGLVATMHNMAAMYLMAAIMLIDALTGLYQSYQH